MTTFDRIGREYAAQILAFVVAMADRLFIPAVFLRMLGITSFSAWSLAVACGAFISVLEFGITRYYTNRLIALVEQEKHGEARVAYREAMTVLTVLVLLASAAISLLYDRFMEVPSDQSVTVDTFWIVLPIVISASAQQMIALRSALYRAHRQFAAETLIRIAGDAGRIVVVIAFALAGASLVTVCWVWLAATILCINGPIWWSTTTRYPGFAGRPRLPNNWADIGVKGPGLWLQSMSVTLFSTVPILAIGGLTASASVIAQFVLLRTIANFVRQILQMFANVFGIELARRHAVGDEAGFALVFKDSNRFLAAQAAAASAALVVLSEPLFVLWTDEPQLFDRTMLILAVLPPLLVPSTSLAVEAFSYANRPWAVVGARLIQIIVTITAFFLLAALPLGTRMMAALLAGEVAGLGVPLIFTMRTLNPLIGPSHGLGLLATSMGCALGVGAIVSLAWIPDGLGLYARVALGLGLAGPAAAIALFFVGMSPSRRRQVLDLVRSFSR